MNRSTMTGVIAGAIAVTAIGAFATTKYGLNPLADYADVVAVEPNFKSTQVPREVCRDEVVTQQAPVKDEKRIAGTAIGAVVGGVLGNQVGSGDGKKLATVAGAAAGGYAGNQIQKEMQQGNTENVSERRCTTVFDSVTSQEGFKVKYRLDGKESVIVMDHDPGERIRVKDGAPVTGSAS
ncbi:MAG: glycine zipper 2TM domain-containing protein [Steroidobacteraceae bacterium]